MVATWPAASRCFMRFGRMLMGSPSLAWGEWRYFVAKQYKRPSPPVLRRSAWLQPPSGPRERCDEFQDFDGSSSRRPMRSWWPTIAVPWVLFVQLPQVRSSPAANARPSGCEPGQDVVPVGRVTTSVHRLALLVERRLLADLVVGAVQVVDTLRDRL